ncbi:MAG: SIR2 family protein [Acidobacteriia bacterium]|nr:SIR2 family protein [Terriglobia bacterium]
MDTEFAGLAKGIAQARYAFWLGSGISRERVDDLRGVIRRILSHLRDRIDLTNAACPYRRALEEAIDLVGISPAERAQIDFSKPIVEWPVIDMLVARLSGVYSRLMDIRIAGHPADYLLWEAVDVPATFVHANPDCEHLCLGILALEGVLPDLVTPNWDGLIETAVAELTNGSGTTLVVCVVPDDLREPLQLTRMLKFHGCAVRAASEPATYRSLLIARYSQIIDWQTNPESAAIRHQLVDIAATKPTLMIGLSAQDVNIQFLFGSARALMHWGWPSDPPAHVFAEDVLGNDQRNILRVVYREAYDTNGGAIEASALLRAYAKPALTALVVHVLGAKLRAFIETVDAPHLSGAERIAVGQGIVILRNRLAAGAEPDRLAFVRSLVRGFAHFIALFQEGTPSAADLSYRPLSNSPVHRIPEDPNLATSGIRELASALGVIGLGESSGMWVVHTTNPAEPQRGVLRVTSSTGAARVFFAANDRASVQLGINGLVAPDDADAILVHSTSPVPKMPRSPLSPPGRVGRAGLRNVGMRDLLLEATSTTHLIQRFREEAIL